MAAKSKAELESEIAELKAQVILFQERAKDAVKTQAAIADRQQTRIDELLKQIDVKNTDIAALKAELFAAQQTVATQCGYITRAMEDDSMRELGPIIDPPERPAAPMSRRVGVAVNGWANKEPYDYGRRSGTAWHDR